MSDQNNRRHEEILERLTAGIAELTTSEAWERWLRFQSRFHHYSAQNVLLIQMQRPDATRVAGFHAWLKLGRHVRKGEKGIAILAPVTRRTRDEDEQGGEDVVRKAVVGFRATYVWDVAQTDGDALEEPPVHRLTGADPMGLFEKLSLVVREIGYTVEDEYLSGGVNGDCSVDERRIRIEVRNDPAQQVKTLAHELAHALLHARSTGRWHGRSRSWRLRALPSSSARPWASAPTTTRSGTSRRGRVAVTRRSPGSRRRRDASSRQPTWSCPGWRSRRRRPRTARPDLWRLRIGGVWRAPGAGAADSLLEPAAGDEDPAADAKVRDLAACDRLVGERTADPQNRGRLLHRVGQAVELLAGHSFGEWPAGLLGERSLVVPASHAGLRGREHASPPRVTSLGGSVRYRCRQVGGMGGPPCGIRELQADVHRDVLSRWRRLMGGRWHRTRPRCL